MLEAVRTSETSVYSNETTSRYNPEGSHRVTELFKFLLSFIFFIFLFLVFSPSFCLAFRAL
jgi:hypothetical protein